MDGRMGGWTDGNSCQMESKVIYAHFLLPVEWCWVSHRCLSSVGSRHLAK